MCWIENEVGICKGCSIKPRGHVTKVVGECLKACPGQVHGPIRDCWNGGRPDPDNQLDNVMKYVDYTCNRCLEFMAAENLARNR